MATDITTLTKEEIQREVERLAPFHHKVSLPFDLSTYIRGQSSGTRTESLIRHGFPPLLEACGGSLEGRRVLDVACNCGGFSVRAAELGSDHVLGIDVVDRYLEQARFIKAALGHEQLEFRQMDVEDLDLSTVGEFDVTFCFGILYHLENPILAMKRIASVTKQFMLVDTRVLPPSSPTGRSTAPLWKMNVPAADGPRHATTNLWREGNRAIQFTPNESAVIALLDNLGFSNVAKIMPDREKDLEPRYYEGTRVTFLASRPSS